MFHTAHGAGAFLRATFGGLFGLEFVDEYVEVMTVGQWLIADVFWQAIEALAEPGDCFLLAYSSTALVVWDVCQDKYKYPKITR